ncbi:MAG: lysophospholipid acyltransferase family protein [Verrucomicrobiota bacterium]
MPTTRPASGTLLGALPERDTDQASSGLAARPDIALPRISEWVLRWFTWYSRRYVRRHFHSLRISCAGLPSDVRGLPLVIYSNHAAWWDPLVFLLLKAEFFAGRKAYAPMDAAMLQRYGLFRRLGFFGVETGSRKGAVTFLRTSETILQADDSLLVVTPQSRFADVRERPIRFAPGLGHLAARLPRAVFLPVVVEYAFWEERLPEILVRFGKPVHVDAAASPALTPEGWTRKLEQELEAIQNALAAEAVARDAGQFLTLLRGGAGQGGVYEAWQRFSAKLRGRSYRPEHGRK